jgi:hypothetical protein
VRAQMRKGDARQPGRWCDASNLPWLNRKGMEGLSWRKGHAESRFERDLIRTRTAEGRIKNLAALGSDRPVGILMALAKDVADIRRRLRLAKRLISIPSCRHLVSAARFKTP